MAAAPPGRGPSLLPNLSNACTSETPPGGRGTLGALAPSAVARHRRSAPGPSARRREARLYPYGDLVSSPGRYVSSYQLSLLERGRAEGMDDRQVSDFLSANLMCGGNSVYRNSGVAPEWMGTVVFAGRWDPPDAMGRRAFYWTLSVEPRRARFPGTRRSGGSVERCAKRSSPAFAVPARELPPEVPMEHWENGQGLLFWSYAIPATRTARCPPLRGTLSAVPVV